MSSAQLELDALPAPATTIAYEWTELTDYEQNLRYVGPDGTIAALVFEDCDGWHANLYSVGGHVMRDYGPFRSAELAQEHAQGESERIGLLVPAVTVAPLCCQCGHELCASCPGSV